MLTLMYVSSSNLKVETAADQIANILQVSRPRNALMAITGALIFTGTHFAQVLEGSAADLDVLMSAISRDKRHSSVTVVDQREILGRRFGDWQMAYHGTASYVGNPVARLLEYEDGDSLASTARCVYSLMSEFARNP